jgi:hypothetical protein
MVDCVARNLFFAGFEVGLMAVDVEIRLDPGDEATHVIDPLPIWCDIFI